MIVKQLAGIYDAAQFAYGCPGGPQPLQLYGSSAAGLVTVHVSIGYITLQDGTQIAPIATSTPIMVGLETVTPTVVAGNPSVYSGQTFLATFASAHGSGDPISSATFGLQEALDYAHSKGGGTVVVSPEWTALGGTTGIINAATLYSGVTIEDNRTGGASGNGTVTAVAGPDYLTWATPTTTPTATSTLHATNAKTGTYQVLAADFASYKTIPVASGTFTITLVASTSQPATGQSIRVINYGSGVVTIARSGQNLNGGTTSITLPAASASAPKEAWIVSDGTNYFCSINAAASGAGWPAILATVQSANWAAVPANAAASGTAGQAAYESGFLYICVATNTWQRVAIATW